MGLNKYLLDLPMDPRLNDVGAITVKEYFQRLLLKLWEEREGFSGKRPFGNSGWENPLYAALINGKVITGKVDEHGYPSDFGYNNANLLLKKAIKSL
jgi:hypothetical protein